MESSYSSIARPINGRSEAISEAEESNANSILVIADDSGSLHYFLDGTFSLGPVSLGSNLFVSSLSKVPLRTVFIAHPCVSVIGSAHTSATPSIIELPLLSSRKPRDLAMLSSASRDLIWYVMRAVKEMRSMWFGSDTTSGAREIGPKWIRALEEKQKEQYGRGFLMLYDMYITDTSIVEEPSPILDLTCLLLTGRASEPLLDYFGSGEQLSERVSASALSPRAVGNLATYITGNPQVGNSND